MKRYLVIYEGIVQGVGFRWIMMTLANQRGWTGTIRNLDNGDVRMELQGEDIDFSAITQGIMKRYPWVRITNFTVKELPVDPHETGFRAY
jgi:acylphosphatase